MLGTAGSAIVAATDEFTEAATTTICKPASQKPVVRFSFKTVLPGPVLPFAKRAKRRYVLDLPHKGRAAVRKPRRSITHGYSAFPAIQATKFGCRDDCLPCAGLSRAFADSIRPGRSAGSRESHPFTYNPNVILLAHGVDSCGK